MAAFKYRPFNDIKNKFEKVGNTELGKFGKAYEFEKQLSPALKEHYIYINKALTAIAEKSGLTELVKSKLATAVLLKVKNDNDETVKKSLLAEKVDSLLDIKADNKLDLRKDDLDALYKAVDKIITPEPKTKFKFLSLEQLGKNTDTLLKEFETKHADKKKTIGKVRQGQVDLIKSSFDRLNVMTLKANKDTIIKKATERLDELTQEIEEADKKIKESNKKLSELTHSKIIIHKNVYSEQEAKKKQLEIEKAALEKFIAEISTVKTLLEEQLMRILSEEQRAKIFTGAWLHVKQLIKKEYIDDTYGVWSFLGWKPEDSVLYTSIEKAIGVTAENRIDAQAENEALTAFNQYVNMVEENRKFDLSKTFKKVEPLSFAKKDIQAQKDREKEMESELVQRKKDLAEQKENEAKKTTSRPPMPKADGTNSKESPKKLIEANLYSPGVNLQPPKKLLDAVKNDKYPSVKNKEEKDKVKNELIKELALYPPQEKKDLDQYPHYERDLSGRPIVLLSAIPKEAELKQKYGNTYLFIENEKIARLLYVKHYFEYKSKEKMTTFDKVPIKHLETFKNELNKLMGEKYDYCSMSSLPQEKKPESNTLYLEYDKQNDELRYTVLDPQGNTVNSQIKTQKLNEILGDKKSSIVKDLEKSDLTSLQPFLPNIIKATSEAGHTLVAKQRAYLNHEQIKTLITSNGEYSHSKSASSFIAKHKFVKTIKKVTKTEAEKQDKDNENKKSVVMLSGYHAMRKLLKPMPKDPAKETLKKPDPAKETLKNANQYGSVRAATAEERVAYKKMTPKKEIKEVSEKEPGYDDYIKALDPDFIKQVKESDEKELQKNPNYKPKSTDQLYMKNHNPTSRLAPPTSFLSKKEEKKPSGQMKDSEDRKRALEQTKPSAVPAITLFRDNMMKKDGSFAKPAKLKPVAPWVYVEDEKQREVMKKKYNEMQETPNISDRPGFKR